MSSKKADPYANLGEFIRRQRELAQLSVRQLAEMCGISNPYLSQIERGLGAQGPGVERKNDRVGESDSSRPIV